jgi:hypothetical protein
VVVSLTLLTRSSEKKTADQETIGVKEETFDVHPIKNFVTGCLSTISKDAIIFMGKQGGYLFKSQGGTLIDYPETDQGIFFVNHENSKVVYNILQPRYSVGIYSASIPNYPWRTFPYTNESRTQQTFEAKDIFGTSNLPPLNKSYGQHSIQDQLITYISNNIDNCLDFSIFEEQGFDITKKEKTIFVDINEQDVTIKMNYEIIADNLVSGEKTNLNDFFVKHKVSLGKLHNFANKIIESDISNVKFDITSSSTEDFDINVIRDLFDNDDLIIITDKKSSFSGLQYKYIFARKNRNPSMFYLPSNLELPRFSEITNETLIENYPDAIIALDPDEDILTIKDLSINPELPIQINLPKMEFQVKVTDGLLEDYQIITINSEEETTT